LSEIASLYFGSSKDWKKIYEANRDQIPASNLIKVGMELAIPAQQ
jgi:nucleoid-associated protein YgaU